MKWQTSHVLKYYQRPILACSIHGEYTFSALQQLLFFIHKITLTSLCLIYFPESWIQSANNLGIEIDKSELQLLETEKNQAGKKMYNIAISWEISGNFPWKSQAPLVWGKGLEKVL